MRVAELLKNNDVGDVFFGKGTWLNVMGRESYHEKLAEVLIVCSFKKLPALVIILPWNIEHHINSTLLHMKKIHLLGKKHQKVVPAGNNPPEFLVQRNA